ncbi:peptide chain release factor N(5)-glutamine methyltransferase [Hansschlegelia quercus]|uniref:Release factor glutamine methyltransferase n=1 Tax=Hansschlegelia quercus TaxID=2528245 RepID=A0A4V2JE55_9HYPH|nr:peptide chain release factor N(5)-glutamine methyltransferase [Hansschlegelia quercus]TBN53986.1 peptide chain release factor N(5)-glutamine methyltransferase [Hansschlegelia quercus]
MTLGEALRAATARLGAAGVDSPDLDARLLALEAFRLDHAALLSRGGDAAPLEGIDRLDVMVARRGAGEPVARILGRREFWGLDFALSPATLVPRPDSETVVQAALDALEGRDGPLRILDLGAGTGCLLLALLSERKDAYGIGVDRSAEAAATARRNARALGLGGRAAFLVGDWAASLSGPFDLVISNPPYIAAGEIAGLDREVREHDPHLALDGGAAGLDAYAAIAQDAPRLMGAGSVLVLELGVGQEADVALLAAAAGFDVRPAKRDLGGVPRALVCLWPGR